MRASTLLRGALLAWTVAAAGCFSPSYTEGGLRCGPAGECPTGYACHDDHCYKGAPPPDMAGDTTTRPICVIGSNAYGDACRFGP